MAISHQTYESLKLWKDEHIHAHATDILVLNQFHDTVMKNVFSIAITHLNQGQPPCDFCWFITGSGGRFEQSLISDQDHGIIYDVSTEVNDQYFLALGKELSNGLNILGYPYCLGNVMSSNPQWCKSVDKWKEQLNDWMEDSSWDSLRYLQIFLDARVLIGSTHFIHALKDFIYLYQQQHPILLLRLSENIMHIKKAISPIGQILVEEKGVHHGAINLKYTAFLPYVNSIRLFAMKEGIYATTTCDRIDQLETLQTYSQLMKGKKANFLSLLHYRLALSKSTSYDDTHYLLISDMTNEEKKKVKEILKDGQKLHKSMIKQIKEGCS